jgi:hypothetical protein
MAPYIGGAPSASAGAGWGRVVCEREMLKQEKGREML